MGGSIIWIIFLIVLGLYSWKGMDSTSTPTCPFTPPDSSNYFTNNQNLRIYTRKWLPENPNQVIGRIFISHGLGEHSGRYDWVAKKICRTKF